MFPIVVRNALSASEMGPCLCISHLTTIFVSCDHLSRFTVTTGTCEVLWTSAPSTVAVALLLSTACAVDTLSFEPCCVCRALCRVVRAPFFLMYFLLMGRLCTH